MFKGAFTALALAVSLVLAGPVLADRELSNVSYDPTRELYEEYNAAFQKYWQAEKNETVTIGGGYNFQI